MQLDLTQQHWDRMCEHVALKLPWEACGLLAGKDRKVERVILVENEAHSAVRFRMDPLEQLQAMNWMESNGYDLLAIFHSHPLGPETVSATDIKEAAYPVVQVIWSRSQGLWRAAGFRILNGEVQSVELQISQS